MSCRAGLALAAVLVVAGCVQVAYSENLNVTATGGVFNGAKAIDGSKSAEGKAFAAAVNLFSTKLNSALSGLQAKLRPALKAKGAVKAEVLGTLLSPLQGVTTKLLNSLIVVREAADVTLKSFLGLLLDNTKELRKTLQDGNAVIDIVRTLRGAKCEAAKFEPPTQKPARISGPAGSLKITTGSCSLKRTADPLKVDYSLECVQPGAAFLAQVPRYTSRFVTAAKAVTEECKVTRKYGVEAETVVTLFNAADFFAAAQQGSSGAGASGANGTAGDLGVNPAAGWFNTMFPLASKLKGVKGKRAQFMPRSVIEAVEKAIKESTVDLTLEYKPFTIKQDMIAAASNVAEALSQTYEVKQKLFKVYSDGLSQWSDPEMTQGLNFNDNLRAVMAKHNISNLFDGVFAKTASRLMSKTHLGNKVMSKLPGVFGEQLTTEKPLRTLLAKARTGAGEPVSIKIEAGLNEAVTQALDAIKGATGDNAWAQLLSKPKKGSLMELLLKNKGTRGHLQDLGKLFDNLGGLGAQLDVLKKATDGSAAGKQAAGTKAADAGQATQQVSPATDGAAATGPDGDADGDNGGDAANGADGGNGATGSNAGGATNGGSP